jgi:glycosyltransferase involved in cell wall biosynthesis
MSCSYLISSPFFFFTQITEALVKGVPVVAYRAGGIPFQVCNCTRSLIDCLPNPCIPRMPDSISHLLPCFCVCHQIRHGETGYLVPVGDTDQVAEHVFQLCTDKVREMACACSKGTGNGWP